ncbi:hypothetical protein Hbl1158_10230 [Halobaculum sp. CBA1158]|uniref:hypothetical protein n=1 Tax=Halobaculum sp. CBA1158 TaxID=2904243 RepID=UPI001F22A483|nr:hypothetical protein [Halobaculum sp. CBA1158]UIO98911.1 hypothetical protein Hbl1158_10230 [Halobaculum sp. CBA1158]
MPSDANIDLPDPDRFFQRIGGAELEMIVHSHDDVTFELSVVPGGGFCVELVSSYSYGGHECNQHVSLGRESAEELRDALDTALKTESRMRDDYVDTLENTCDECGSGGGGLCPECKDDAEVHSR